MLLILCPLAGRYIPSTSPSPQNRLLIGHCFPLIHYYLRKVFPDALGLGEHLLWAPWEHITDIH